MLHNFTEGRLSLLREVLEAGGFKEGRQWGLQPSRIRFILAKSPKEMKVPYLWKKDDIHTIENAIAELIALISKRHGERDFLSSNMELSADSIGVLRRLPERSYRMDLFPEGSIIESVVKNILLFSDLIDGGILQGWFGTNGQGRLFMNLLMKIYSKALLEESHLKGREITAYLTHIALINSLNRIKDRFRKVVIRGVSYESLDHSIGIALFFIQDTSVRKVLKDFAKNHPLYKLKETSFLLRSTITPWSFLSIKDTLTKSHVNPYYMTKELVHKCLTLHIPFPKKAKEIEDIIKAMVVKAEKNKGLAEAVIQRYKAKILRESIFKYISKYADHGIDGYGDMEKAFRDERMLLRIISDEGFRKEWMEGIGRLKDRFSTHGKKVEVLGYIEDFLRLTKKRWLSGLLEGGKETDQREAFKDAMQVFLSYRFDKEVERFLSPRKTMLVDREHDLSYDGALKEYEKGRVYLLSTDRGPILKKLGTANEGQLYIDMKDFTRSTFKVKEITMADFMRNHFYKPILDVASKYAVGGLMMEDAGSIRLENLLGDAFIYSGSISSLVFLAEDIHEIMERYRRELEAKLQSLKIGDPLRETRENYEILKGKILMEKEELERRLKRREEIDRWIDILDREEDLERAFKEETSANGGREIEAGLFISYGAKAERFNLKNEQWGEREVAIGEKINEASRGVNRNPLIRKKVERLLKDTRKRLNVPQLKLPFDVYIERTYNIDIDPEFVSSINEAIVNRESGSSEKITKCLASRFFTDLREVLGKGTLTSSRYLIKIRDIYNNGHALSEEALHAFFAETKSYIRHFNKIIKVSELHPSIRERFFFIKDSIDLWFSVKEGEDKVLIFRKVGEIVFKGFEPGGAITVYEMLKRGSEFYRMIMKYHFNSAPSAPENLSRVKERCQ